MPVSPADVIELLEEATDWSTRAMLDMDKQLNDKQFLQKEVKRDAANNLIVFFSIPGRATNGDKSRVKSAYENVGWDSVEIVNSDENGERSGLVSITLRNNN